MSHLRGLTADEIAQARQDLPAWTVAETTMSRSLKLADFSAAFALMCRIAMLAEKADHHPEWHNVYNKLDIVLSTHDVGGLSQKDVAMAKAIDKLVA